MLLVHVLYPNQAGSKFDLDYYMKTHMPLVEKRWTEFGLKSWRVARGIDTPMGPATYQIVTTLEFTSADDFQKAAAAHGPEIMGDIPNFTDTSPVLQFSETVQ